MKKLIICIALVAAMLLNLCPVLAETAGTAADIDISEYFSNRDLSGAWDADEAIAIDLNAQSEIVSITAAGTYVLSGTLNGSVSVSVGDDDKVQLVLNGVTITADVGAAIYVENADKTFITLAEGTANTLTSKAFDESGSVDAVIFSRDDLTLNGSGSLTIVSANHGVVGKDDLKITGGTYTITAEGRGVDANDSVRIYDGSFTIVSAKDAIRAKESEKEGKGYVLIVGGAFDLTVGGGAANASSTHTSDMGFGRSWQYSASQENSVSAKGVKAAKQVTVLGGSFTVDSSDDAFHTDGDMLVNGGSFYIKTGDDGMHADDTLTINGGTITIAQSYEGLEGTVIAINGGDISLTASDDGINAAGGSDSSGYSWYDRFNSSSSAHLYINGGNLYVNAGGDGLDSNGDLTVTGGTVVVSGPTSSADGALDYDGTAVITGGTVIAAGASGMAENFGTSSTQVSMLVSLSGQAGTVTVKDSQGNVVLSGTVEKSFQCVVISSPELKVGETYTVSCGNASTSVTVTSTITGGSGGFGMGGGRTNQQMPGGQQQQPGGQGGGRRW